MVLHILTKGNADKLKQRIKDAQGISKEYRKQLSDYEKEKTYMYEKIFKNVYRNFLLLLVLIILGFTAGYLLKIDVGYLVLYILLAIPFSFATSILAFLKFTMFDLPEIIDYIKLGLSINYLIAVFFKNNKTLDFVVRPIRKDGKSFEYKKGLYVVDADCIYITGFLQKFSLSFYIEGLPNPLKFNFKYYLSKFMDMIDESIGKNIDIKPVLDYDGDEVIISYSSANLLEMEKDKFMKEVHRDATGEANKLMIGMMVLLGIALFVVLFSILNRGG